jgi:UDP-N-acetylmuramate dehydrogenase
LFFEMLLSFHFGILINMIEPSYVSLAQYSSLRIGGKGLFVEVSHEEELLDALQYAQKASLEPYIIGGGTNTFFGKSLEGFLFIHPTLKGVAYNAKGDDVCVTAGAGEMWDSLVKEVTEKGLWGIENLSYIPGTVGAAPVQNIGAYGVSLSDVFVSLQAIDCNTFKNVTLDRKACRFGYRDSLFKQEKGRYVVVSVTLCCHHAMQPILTYKPLDALIVHEDITPVRVRDLVVATRKSKLPEYRENPNCGSFFKNPIVANSLIETMQTTFKNMPVYKVSDGQSKLSAGWLIEQLGYKGTAIGPVGVYEKNALVLYNRGGATLADLEQAIQEIATKVSNRFAITLICEPLILKI